ncbi:sulfotransferase [Allomuricauda sp.]|uniref:sulfotransferase n=1 Tax=Flagellimonas alginolytica TaxID=3177515 RepID=UPI0025E33F08|nr:sulfotransferase [Allomuricauda sp.]
MKKINLIYLLGAGRSGTTLMATILNAHKQVQTIGEMHQFIDHINQDKECSCGENLNNCVFWSKIVENLKMSLDDLPCKQIQFEKKEAHKNLAKLILKYKQDKDYLEFNEKVFSEIKEHVEADWILDSSKYIARYLLLEKSVNINIKGIYVVRDVRGVINSFGKQVQTPKKPLSTIVYYLAINFFGQIVFALDPKIIKVKYEDFVEKPEQSLNKIYSHVFATTDGINNISGLPEFYEMPHIIGGNRMKANKKISIRKDEKWKENISRSKQIMYYLLVFPLMLLNKYKI